MPSRAWVVTARISNILNFSWYFLCIPAIYRCILAYLPIFFNQLSKFLRCESPSTFLGTCLSHHSFIIFLVTNTNTLLSGLHLISTLYYEKTVSDWIGMCQCPLGLIPHFYVEEMISISTSTISVSMPSRAYTSFLLDANQCKYLTEALVSMPSRAYTSFLQWASTKSTGGMTVVSMPSRAYTSFLRAVLSGGIFAIAIVSMPSRAYTSFLHPRGCYTGEGYQVSMPSRAYTSFLPRYIFVRELEKFPVSMPSRAYTSFLLNDSDVRLMIRWYRVNALSGLYLISTELYEVY